MKHQLILGAILLSCATSAFAQQFGQNGTNGNNNNRNGNNRNGQNGRGGGATLPLPKGVDRLISIDAYNTLLAESQDDDGERTYTPIVVRHVYSGGIAALFGGTSIPTEQFVTPGFQNSGNGNGNGNGFGGFGGNQIGGNQGNQSGFNQGGFNQGNQNGGFNQGGFNQGNQGGFTQGGFINGNASVGFNGAGINNGFNSAGNGQIFQTPNGGFGTTQTSVIGPNGKQIPLANGPFFVR